MPARLDPPILPGRPGRTDSEPDRPDSVLGDGSPVLDPARLDAVRQSGLLDPADEEAFDRATRLVRRLLGVPVAHFAVVDADHQVYKSQLGLPEPLATARTMPLSHSLCKHVVASGHPLIVGDARADARLQSNPSVREFGVRAYLGVPVRSPDGHVLGSLCGLDVETRVWTADDEATLLDIAASVEAEIKLRMELAARSRSEDQYRTLFEGASDAILLLDPETEVVLDANEQAAALYGYARAELIGTSLRALSTDPARGEVATERLLGGSGAERFESVQYRGDGSPVHVTISASAVHVDGRPAILSINRDVTAQRVAEAALRESRAQVDRLALIAERTTNGVVVTDADGRTEWVNEGLTRITGYTLDELRGRKPGVLLQGPETDPETVVQIAGYVARREPFAVEIVNHHRDGRPYWIRIEATPLFGDDGAFEGFMAIETDVTERKQAEEVLRASEARYRAVVESVRDAVVQTDMEGRWTFLNPAWETITGFTVGESLGRSAFEFVHPDDHALHGEMFGRLAGGSAPFVRFESRYLTRGGGVRHVEVHAQLVRDDTGAVTGTAGTVTDITDTVRFEAEREARERTEEMLRIKSSFLNNMSHELRTPLTGILGFAEVLADEVPDDLKETVEVITRSAQRLSDTLNSVLDLAQLEASDVRLELVPADVYAKTGEVFALIRPVAEKKGVRLKLSGRPVLMLADRTALYRVLTNLVGNAVKFTEAGTVEVDVGASEGMAWFRVSDTGIGMPATFVPHVFDEFKQVSEGYGRSHEGNGLGLTIVKRLVGLMGGEVAVESSLGVGTTFTVTLPAVSDGDGADNGARSTSERRESAQTA